MPTQTTVRILRTAAMTVAVLGLAFSVICWASLFVHFQIPYLAHGTYLYGNYVGRFANCFMAIVFGSSVGLLHSCRWAGSIGLLGCFLYIAWAWLPAL